MLRTLLAIQQNFLAFRLSTFIPLDPLALMHPYIQTAVSPFSRENAGRPYLDVHNPDLTSEL